jgi:Gram-negative bacterial TonB protein C-terminal
MHSPCYKCFMPSLGPLAQGLLHVLLSILSAQSSPKATTPVSEVTRIHLKENAVSCFTINSIPPVYLREARLAHTEGVVKLALLIADDGSMVEMRAISGDPLLFDSAIKAVREWRFSITRVVGHAVETEIPLSFTFSPKPPKPAYLHLTNGRVIRADEVREFTNGIEYAIGRRTHHIPANSVADINACARVSVILPLREGDCIPSGGTSFSVRAIPLLLAVKTNHSGRPALR